MWFIINGMCLLLNSFLWKHALGPCVPCQPLEVCRGAIARGRRQETTSVKRAAWKGQGSCEAHGSKDPRLPLTPIQMCCGSCRSAELPEL